MKKIISVKEKINNINSLVSQLKSSKLSLIEKDIILQSIRELYIEVNEFETSENSPEIIVEKNTTILKKETIEEAPVENVIINEPAEQVVVEASPVAESEIIEYQNIVEEKPAVVETPKPVAKPTQNQQTNLFGAASQQAEPATVGDKLGQNKTSINDSLSNNVSNDISHRIAQKPISDIKSAIGIGDRLLYIRELFSGNNDTFEEAIAHLNTLNSFDEAKSYLSEKCNLDFSSETASSFINVVKRKFV